MPEVVPVRPGLFNVVHRYNNPKDPMGTGAVVPTSVSIVESWRHRTIAIILPDRRIVEFPTALLWKYHGKGCEGRSRIRYDRLVVEI